MGKFLRNALFGIAVGDALGVPHEKKPRGSFKCLGWDYTPEPDRKRTWSDDTALTLAELDSLGTLKRVDFDAIMQNFMEWFLMGKFSCTGRCFGAGKEYGACHQEPIAMERRRLTAALRTLCLTETVL